MSELVSCVMPTANRRKYVPGAIRSYLSQDYPEIELIVVDDGADCVADLMPLGLGITYVRLGEKLTTGAKRNLGVRLAHGSIICNWDDDDWSAPNRVSSQVERLRVTGKAVTGYSSTIYYSEADRRFYRNGGPRPPMASGTSQCFLKKWWELHPFPEKTIGEDSEFSVLAQLAGQLDAQDCGQFMVARSHATSTCPVELQKFTPWPAEQIPSGFMQEIGRSECVQG